MRQHPASHLIATEVERLRLLRSHEQEQELSNRIDRTFQMRLGSEADSGFKLALDFNAHLVTLCRNRGVIWAKSA